MMSRPHTSRARLFVCALILLVRPVLVAADGASVYVAPGGDDAAAGTREKPFRTPARARDAVRKLKRDRGGKLDGSVNVVLRGGTYFLKEPLGLTQDDGGASGAEVVYSAQPNETPVLSGGVAVTGWAKKELNGRQVWAATVPPEARSAPLRSLWVNGHRAVRARHPNAGYVKVDEVPEATGDWMKGVASFRYAGADLKDWSGVADGAETLVMSRWVESRMPVKGVDAATRTIAFSKKSVFIVEKGDLYWVEGVGALLDEPGEWYADRATSTLYYLPRASEDMTKAEAVVPVLSQVLRIEAKGAEGKVVEHLTFRGVTFSHTDWGQGWPNWPDERSGYNQAAIGVPAAVLADGARHCTFDACTVSHVGTYALELGRGCRDNRVTHCSLTDLGAGGVKIGETAIRMSEPDQNCRNEVYDCRITNGGKLFPSAVGLWIGQSFDNTIAHNEIADFYYTGISVGWTWGYGKSAARGNVIEHNDVHHIGKPSDDEHAPILSDMAGIYTLGIQPGTVVRHNRFHDIAAIKYGGWGIYFDEGSSEIVAENNLVYRTTHGGFHQHYGKDNVFRNNIIAFGRDAQIQRSRSEPHRSFTFERNIVYWAAGDPVTGSWDNCNVAFDRNVYWPVDGKTDFPVAKMTPEQWHQKGQDQHSLVADPGFANPGGDDFTLRPDSPALAVGFVPFELDGFGPRKRESK